ncbi:MAG: nuclear transport factor 2 family protein [Balneolaceae bacterium]
MKRPSIYNFIPLIVLLLVVMSYAKFSFSKKQSSNIENQREIEKVITGYIENFFLNQYQEMEVVLHDRISKRGINEDGNLSEECSKKRLQEIMNNKEPLPLEMQKNRIKDITLDDNVATAILETGYPTDRWKEYIQLAKIDNQWIIMDIFWDYKTEIREEFPNV